MLSDYDYRRNRLLAYLPDEEAARILYDSSVVPLAQGQILYQPGLPLEYAYFPIDAIISLLSVTEDGSSAETAIIGNEGVLGTCIVMGENTTTCATVQRAGKAYKIRSGILKREFERGATFQQLLLFYTQVLITQMTQTALCNRYHLIDQQLCRWLLLNLDRMSGNELVATQELISNELGVRREGVTEAAKRLQETGLIQYSRGHITVRDRLGLEARACECYHVVKAELDRLFPDNLFKTAGTTRIVC